jgi:nickel/cobalt transporter (NicO) family protein
MIRALAWMVLALATTTASANPFGVGIPETQMPPVDFGPLAGLAGQIAVWQSDLYRLFSAAVRSVRTDPWAAGFLCGLGFLYGIIHAAGPGHGKAVVSAYILASHATLKRGIIISFAAAFMQGLVAIGLISVMVLALNATAMSMTRVGHWLELASHVLVIGIGIALLWRGLIALLPVRRAASLSAAASHIHNADGTCCANPHIPDPRDLEGRTDLWSSLAAIVSIGIRPCTGAILVLVFALTQQVFWVGILAVLAMSLGTAMTVSLLAAIAVGAKGLAVAYARPGGTGGRMVAAGLTLAGGGLVLGFGVLLLMASLSRGALTL